MAWPASSVRSRLISATWVTWEIRKPSGPWTTVSKVTRRAWSRVKRSSSSRKNGPIAHEALLSLARPSSSALRPSTSRRFTSLPSVTAAMAPSRLITSTSSGSGLLHTEAGCTPTRAPSPTAAIGGHLLKSSASGPMPTSRYCDHILLDARRLGRAGRDAAQIGAHDGLDLAPRPVGEGRVALGALLDHPLEHARDERHPARLHRVQVRGGEQPRLARVA